MTQEPDSDELLTREEVLQRTRIASATMYRLRERGEFPEPVTFGRARSDGRPVSTAWRASVIDAWMASRKVEPDADALIAAPTGPHIVMRPHWSRAADAEAFARGLGSYGARVHARGPREFAVWFAVRPDRAERQLAFLRQQCPGFRFETAGE